MLEEKMLRSSLNKYMQNQVPNNWQKVKLKEITLQINRGFQPSYTEKQGVIVINQKCVRDGRVDLSESRLNNLNKKTISVDKYLKPLDILINSTGTGTVGRVGQIVNVKQPISFDSHVTLVRPDPSKIDGRYLGYVLGRLEKYFENLADGSTNQVELSRERVRDIELTIPPITDQKKTSSMLSAFDDKIEVNNKIARILEITAQAIFKEWFVNFRFPGYEKIELINSELGKIPRGWKIKLLKDIVCEVRESIDPKKTDSNVPYLGMEHLPRRSLLLTEWGNAKDVVSTKLRFKKGDILFGKIRPYFHKVLVAPMDGICSTDILVMKSVNDNYFGIALSHIFSDKFVNFSSQSSQGTNMPRAKWEALSKYPVIIPDDRTLETFNKIVTFSIQKINIIIVENQKLADLRDLLLPKLMKGEIKIND